jgi:hypothetical protein
MNATDEKESEKGPKSSMQANRLIALCESSELFRSSDGIPYATVPVGDHVETFAIESTDFKNWLRRCYFNVLKSAPNQLALQDAIGNLTARAQFEGQTYPVFLRVGSTVDRVYVDLCNDAWEIVEIAADGWRVLPGGRIKFRRSRRMTALPHPLRPTGNHSVNNLQKFLNLRSIDDFRLVVAFILSALNPSGPYFVLVLYGEQGTAKSTTVRVIRSLIDPNSVPLRREPRVPDDLLVSAKHNWLVAIDNMSHLPEWLSDDLCRLATGGGLSKREQYSNDEETVLDAKRPIILNGIAEFVTRGDLASRSITLNLPKISEDNRKREKAFWKDFEELRPYLLGAIFDGIAAAIQNENKISLSDNLRMADAWHWVTAAERAFGWEQGSTMAAFRTNESEANEAVLGGSLIFPHIQELAEPGWCGTPTDLLSKLNSMRSPTASFDRGWPQRPRGLTDQLRRLNPALRAVEIEVTLDGRTSGSNSERRITIGRCLKSSVANDATPIKLRDLGDVRDANSEELFDFNGPERIN